MDGQNARSNQDSAIMFHEQHLKSRLLAQNNPVLLSCVQKEELILSRVASIYNLSKSLSRV
jgi:hypothetical protein